AHFPITQGRFWGVEGGLSVGYGYVEGRYAVSTRSGTPLEDVIRLHRVPITAFVEPYLEFSAVPWVRPSLPVSLGAQWFFQSGTLDGIEQGFWLPFYRVGPRLTFFPARNAESTFR